MKISLFQEILGHTVPFATVILGIAAIRMDSVPLSMAVLIMAVLAMHLCRVEYMARREELLSQRTDLMGQRRASRMDHAIFELWLLVGSSRLGYIAWCGVSGIAGLLFGVVALVQSIAPAAQ